MQGRAPQKRNESPAADLAGLRVLVVEDHAEFQYFLAFVLRYFGAEVRGATSAEAIGTVCAFKPEVIVVGIGLPGQDTLIHSIRAMPPEQGGKVPAVAVAPFGRPENHAPTLSLGFQTYVPLSAPRRSWHGQWAVSPGGLAKPRRHSSLRPGGPFLATCCLLPYDCKANTDKSSRWRPTQARGAQASHCVPAFSYNRKVPLRTKVLIVDDDADERGVLSVMASEWGYTAETAADGQDAIEKLEGFPADVIITDLNMPRLDGFRLLRLLQEQGKNRPTIVITAYGDMDKAVTTVHELGAFWFLDKPFDLESVRVLLRRASDHSSLAQEKDRLQCKLAHKGMLGEIVGRSEAMQTVFDCIQQVAPTSASVLITGESGTGKEMVAQTIHKLSPRRNGPFVAINCAALPESLIESELFGHEKGAFTGAVGRRAGCFELAQGGTLLLDEIGEMQPTTQAKLLRVLEDGRVRRLGAQAEVQVDVRVLASTNKVPELAISKGELRSDLFYRLSVFHIQLPPLRDRPEDIEPIAQALLPGLNQKHSCHMTDLDPAALAEIQRYSWPGNVRELRNVLERAAIVAGEGTITPAHLPDFRAVAAASQPPPQNVESVTIHVGATLSDLERDLILTTMEHTANNKRRAAEILGIHRRTLYKKLRAYGWLQPAA